MSTAAATPARPGEVLADRLPFSVAEYGLAALVVGGAAAAATKTGAGKAVGKMLIYGGIAAAGAVGAALKKFFRRSA